MAMTEATSEERVAFWQDEAARLNTELKQLREFVREFRKWQTTADLNALAVKARELDA